MALENLKLAQHEARAKLADLKNELVAAMRTVTSPDDPKIDEIDRAIGEQEARIRRLDAMEVAGKELEDQAAVAVVAARRAKGFEEANALAAERVKVAAKLDKAIASIAPLLEEFERIGVQCQAAASEVHRFDKRQTWAYSILNAARGNDGRIGSALEQSLLSIGLGTKGIPADIDIRRGIRLDPVTIEQAAATTAERLKFTLTESMQQSIGGV